MKNTNVLKSNEGLTFEQFLAGGIDIARKLPEGDHKATFKGLDCNILAETITIKVEVDGNEYNDTRKFKSDKVASLEITLKHLGIQLELQGNVPLAEYNNHIGKEITIYARVPEGYKTVFYNYSAPYQAPEKTESATVVDGKDF